MEKEYNQGWLSMIRNVYHKLAWTPTKDLNNLDWLCMQCGSFANIAVKCVYIAGFPKHIGYTYTCHWVSCRYFYSNKLGLWLIQKSISSTHEDQGWWHIVMREQRWYIQCRATITLPEDKCHHFSKIHKKNIAHMWGWDMRWFFSEFKVASLFYPLPEQIWFIQ